jgi:hypothetical protein
VHQHNPRDSIPRPRKVTRKAYRLLCATPTPPTPGIHSLVRTECVSTNSIHSVMDVRLGLGHVLVNERRQVHLIALVLIPLPSLRDSLPWGCGLRNSSFSVWPTYLLMSDARFTLRIGLPSSYAKISAASCRYTRRKGGSALQWDGDGRRLNIVWGSRHEYNSPMHTGSLYATPSHLVPIISGASSTDRLAGAGRPIEHGGEPLHHPQSSLYAPPSQMANVISP